MMDLFRAENWKGGRKLVAFALALAAVFVLGVLNRMDGGQLEGAINWIVSAFVAGNVGEYIANGRKEEPEA